MAWRAIHDDVAESESLARLSDFAERLYWRMLAATDPWGRLPGSPAKIRARCIPLLDRPADMVIDMVAAALDELETVGRISLYQADGKPYLEILDFAERQPRDVTGRDGKRYASRYPAPPGTPPEPTASPEERPPGHADTVGCPAAPADRMVEPKPPPKRGLTRSYSEQLRVSPPESESESESELGSNRNQPTTGTLVPASSAKTPTGDAAVTDAVRQVYECWRTERDRTSRRYDTLSPGRRTKIAARLREFSPDELCAAIRAVSLDPWPDRSRHDDLTVLLRSREQVERFLELAEASPSGQAVTAAQPAPTTLRYGRGMTARQVLDATRGLQ